MFGLGSNDHEKQYNDEHIQQSHQRFNDHDKNQHDDAR